MTSQGSIRLDDINLTVIWNEDRNEILIKSGRGDMQLTYEQTRHLKLTIEYLLQNPYRN